MRISAGLARGRHAGTLSREEHEYWCTEVGDPARKEERGADVWIGHRIHLAAEVEIVPHMIDGHDHDRETA